MFKVIFRCLNLISDVFPLFPSLLRLQHDTWLEMNECAIMSMLVIDVSSRRNLTFWFILKERDRSVTVDFITFVEAFESLLEGVFTIIEDNLLVISVSINPFW